MALPSASNGGVPVGPVASTQLLFQVNVLFTSLAAYFDFSAQPRPLGRGLMQSMEAHVRHSPDSRNRIL